MRTNSEEMGNDRIRFFITSAKKVENYFIFHWELVPFRKVELFLYFHIWFLKLS
jgi:hypothetical protein